MAACRYGDHCSSVSMLYDFRSTFELTCNLGKKSLGCENIVAIAHCGVEFLEIRNFARQLDSRSLAREPAVKDFHRKHAVFLGTKAKCT